MGDGNFLDALKNQTSKYVRLILQRQFMFSGILDHICHKGKNKRRIIWQACKKKVLNLTA